jgi:hypothetical protein
MIQRMAKKKILIYKGHDSNNKNLIEIDSPLRMTYEEKLKLITALTLFEYQRKNNTTDVPRFLRTTALIRKP